MRENRQQTFLTHAEQLMDKIKVAHIITHLELGGAQKTTLSLLAHIDKQRYEVHLLSCRKGLFVEDAMSIPGVFTYFIPELAREIHPLNDIISFVKISTYLRRHRISIVHTHSPKAGFIGRWAAWFSGVRNIFHTVHGWPFYIEANRLVQALYLWLEKISAFITNVIIVVSDADLNAGLLYVHPDKRKYRKVSYGIESSRFLVLRDDEKKNTLRRQFCISEAACVVGYVSCFKPQKAPLDFVRVAKMVTKQNANVQFLSLGDGYLRPAAERLAQQYNLNGAIKFLGWRKDVADIFSVMDILLLTSRWEGLPVVFLEAMASGLPIVATDVGGAREVIKPGVNGFLEEKGDCEALANDILYLAANPDKRNEFRQRSRSGFCLEFDISHMARQTETIYAHRIGKEA